MVTEPQNRWLQRTYEETLFSIEFKISLDRAREMAQWVKAVALKVLSPEFRPQRKRKKAGYGHVCL